MFAPYQFAQLLALLMVTFLLSACGGGGGSSDQSTTFDIEGRVLNGPLDGSTVQVFGANGVSALGTATTDGDGRYAAQISRAGPYRLRASGGKLNGVDYTGVLEAACASGSNCFVTPYTTVILRLVDDHGFNTGDAASHLATSLDFDGDPFAESVPAETFDLDAARQAIAGGDGLAAWVAGMVAWATSEDAEPPPGVGGSGSKAPPGPPGEPDPAPPPEPDPEPDPEPVPDPEPEPIVPGTYTVSAAAGDGGGISPTSQEVDHGATATFAVTPATGYSIDTVTGCDGNLDGNAYTTGAITGACTVEASFLLNSYTVSAPAGTGGSISPTSQVISHGDTAVFTLQREPGFGISRVTGCGGTRVGDIYTTAPIEESCTVEGVFGELVYVGTKPINDTGIDWCADAANNYDLGDDAYKTMQCEAATNAGFAGQDGHHGRDALARAGELPKLGDGAAGFDYTKISNSGEELPATANLGSGANDWACTRDNVTGLIWEVKTADGGLRDRNNTYTWYQPDGPNMGNPGTQNGGSCVWSSCDTYHYVQAVNAMTFCGARDWRLPALGELRSLVHHGRRYPVVDTDFFPNTPLPSYFWSASPLAGSLNSAWGIDFGLSYEGSRAKSFPNWVRAVRGGQ